MTGNPPRVSVIIPVHNCERYLGEAMESVLTQTYKSFELIVVDDGSTDATARVARGFASSVRYCFQQQRGAGAARNRGVEMAQGRYLAFLDADDLWLEGKLARQLEAFEADPGLDMVFGQVEHFVSPELDEDFKRTLRCPAKLMPGYAPSAMMVKRNSFYAVGPFETHWRVAEFIDWYSKAQERGLKGCMPPQVVVKRRLHTSNIGILEVKSRAEYAHLIKASLDRRRKMGFYA